VYEHRRYPESPDLGRSLVLTRRDLVRAGLGAGMALGAGPLLAACGGEEEEPAPTPGAPQDISGTINFFSWEGYDLLKETAQWRKANGVEIKSAYIATHADIQAKFTTGGGKGLYNLTTYNAGYGQAYQELGILAPIDVAKIPNYEKLFPFFREGEAADRWWTFEGETWGIPFTWGGQGMNYDSEAVDPPTKWVDLLEPEFKNRIAFMDDMRGGIGVGAQILGFFSEESQYTPEQMDEIFDLLGQFKSQARAVTGSYGDLTDLFVRGEVVAVYVGWAAVNEFAAAKGKATVEHFIPEEGAWAFVDSWVIPPESEDVDTVLAFIDHSLSPEVQAAQAKSLSAGVVTLDAVPLLEPEAAELYPYDDIESFFETTKLAAVPFEPPEEFVNFDEWLERWETFLAA
jgi:spermidine/putrescine transport system substrate-binding protein